MKTAEQLGISPEELAALIKTRDYLMTAGKDTFVESEPEEYDGEEDLPAGLNFNMLDSCRRGYECGTVACIGGTASLFMQGAEVSDGMTVLPLQEATADQYVGRFYVKDRKSRFASLWDEEAVDYRDATSIQRLYFPRIINDWDQITPLIAARAIDNFLFMGDPHWETLALAEGLTRAD